MPEVLQFVWAVAQHWQALLTGGLVIAALGAIERKKERPVPWKAFKWIATVALFVACYMAWHDEHKIAMKVAETGTLRSQVVALIQELKAFHAERSEIELGSNGDWHLQEQTRQLFLDRFSQRLIKLSNNLPRFLVREGRLIQETAEAPSGGGTSALDGLISTLESVSASL